jgi:hypothetical protein
MRLRFELQKERIEIGITCKNLSATKGDLIVAKAEKFADSPH